jgi:hypothetical protein
MSARVLNVFNLLSSEDPSSEQPLTPVPQREERSFEGFLKLPCVSPEKRLMQHGQQILQPQPLSLRVL